MRAAFAYEGVGAVILRALKFSNARGVATVVASMMAPLVRSDALTIVTWAPTSAIRRRRRGYDQAEVLARALARQLGLPCAPLLTRRARDGPQTGRNRADRLDGPTFAARRQNLAGHRVGVVDDVVTTGATLVAACHALRGAGAEIVIPIVAAATPNHAVAATMRGVVHSASLVRASGG